MYIGIFGGTCRLLLQGVNPPVLYHEISLSAFLPYVTCLINDTEEVLASPLLLFRASQLLHISPDVTVVIV